ncbi:MAG TPA: carbonic anhydrase family protein [Solirubrobacteraceae bacterium]
MRYLVLVVAAMLVAGCGSSTRSTTRSPARTTTTAAAVPGDPEAESSPEWSYAGATGPARWGALDRAFRACATGRRQSPINLAHAARAKLPALRLAYGQSTLELESNGHSVEAASGPGNRLTVGGVHYSLVQFHYHAPSEHRIDGRSFPLELHLVNKSPDGQALVLGALVRAGHANPAFARLIAALPTHEGQHRTLTGFDPLSLLPGRGRAARYAYTGSLTTPPCTEGVRWNVFATPVELSPAQIRRFTSIYDHHNRPLQPRNGRPLVVGTGG